MAISLIFLFMRISSSRLLSVRFVMRVHWIRSVCCGGIIIVPTAVVCCGVWFSGVVSCWFIISVFQFWFSFIWFVAGLCWIRSASVRNWITFWALSLGISSFCVISSMLCQTLSFSASITFSSFVDKGVPSVWVVRVFILWLFI